MSGERETPSFLELPFDWFVLEKWQSDFEELSRAEVQKRLGEDYAELGFKGRRVFAIKADLWSNSQRESLTPSRDISTVPQDLLPARIRRVCRIDCDSQPTLVRVDYSPDSQARFDRLINDLDDDPSIVLGGDGNVIDDEQYCSLDSDLLPALYAILPCLLDPRTPYYGATEEQIPFDSEELQNGLYMANDPNYPEDDRRVLNSTDCFVADNEAMMTGMLLWLRVDEYGIPVLQERIAPSPVRDVVSLRGKRDIQEFREYVAGFR